MQLSIVSHYQVGSLVLLIVSKFASVADIYIQAGWQYRKVSVERRSNFEFNRRTEIVNIPILY